MAYEESHGPYRSGLRRTDGVRVRHDHQRSDGADRPLVQRRLGRGVQPAEQAGNWTAEIPGTVQVRRSDDVLHYDCASAEGLAARGDIPSRMGGKIIASAVFLDFGIVDSITDKHREYPPSFVIPIR